MKKFKIFATTVFVFSIIFNFIDLIFNNNINVINPNIIILGPEIITAIITTIITTAISYLLAPKPKLPDAQSTAKGVLLNKDSNNNPIPVVYGNRQLGIIKVFVENSGGENKFLYIAGVLCEGEITSIDEIYVDDKLVIFDGALTDGTIRQVSSSDKNFFRGGKSLISIQAFYGTDNQSASSLLDETSNWTTNHKLSGIAYIAMKCRYNANAFNGSPEVRVTVKGRKIYDPRLDSTKGGSGSHRQDDPTTWAYSPNSSLVLLDYLRNTRYGKGVPNNGFETNYDSFKTSANTADSEVVAVESTVSDSAGLRLENYSDYFNDNLNHFKSRSLTTDATTQLSNAIDNTVTTIPVDSTSNFSSTGRITINSEIISYSGKTSTTFTGCVRGVNGTTATSHLDNDTVTNPPEQTITAISSASTQNYKSKIYYGYFNPVTTGSYLFKTTSKDSSLVYVGTAGQDIFNLFNDLEIAPTFNHSSISSYLKVNNSGLHNSTSVESSGVSMVSGESYPIIIYHGKTKVINDENDVPLDSTHTFEWKLSGGNYSTVLTDRFTDGLASDLIVPLFQTNGVLDSEKKLIDNVRELLVPMRAIFNYTQGKYKVIIEGTGSSQLLLTKDNVVSEVKLQGESKSEKFNRVIGTFSNPKKDFQSDTVSYPPFDDSNLAVDDQHATMLSEDNGTLLEKSFDMLQVTSPYQAEEICENILKRSRNNLKAEVTVTSEALNLSIGDIVTATYDTAGFSSKPFRVMSLAINSDSTVSLGIEEHQDNFYTYEGKGDEPTIPDTVLPDPFTVVAPASVTLSDQLIEYSDGVVITALDVVIGASTDEFVDYYEVEYKLSTDATFQVSGQVKGLNHRILNVIDGLTYQVQVRAINTLGAESTYTSATRTIIGGIAPPADVEDFACNIIGGDAHLSWTQISDLDLAHYSIRFSTLTSGATWGNSVSLVEKVARPATSVTVPARVGSYLIKAVDKNGNLSSNETIIATNVVAIGNYNAIATQTESPTFSGTKTNVFVSDNALRLDSSEFFDSAIGNFDDATGFFDSGLTAFDLYATGNYLFSNPVDIGGVYTTRVTASITQSSDNLDDLFDSRSGNFDDAGSNFDGDTPANCNAHLEIALSDDNITYTSFRNFVVGDYTSRFYKFRVVLTSFDLSSTPVITALTVNIDAPDRIFSGNDLTSGAGTFTVTFTNPFFSDNYAVGITAQSLGTGNFYDITSKTISGFNITFRDSGGTAISKTFDFLAKGY